MTKPISEFMAWLDQPEPLQTAIIMGVLLLIVIVAFVFDSRCECRDKSTDRKDQEE